MVLYVSSLCRTKLKNTASRLSFANSVECKWKLNWARSRRTAQSTLFYNSNDWNGCASCGSVIIILEYLVVCKARRQVWKHVRAMRTHSTSRILQYFELLCALRIPLRLSFDVFTFTTISGLLLTLGSFNARIVCLNAFSNHFLQIALTSTVCTVVVFGPTHENVLNLFAICNHRSTITNKTEHMRLPRKEVENIEWRCTVCIA